MARPSKQLRHDHNGPIDQCPACAFEKGAKAPVGRPPMPGLEADPAMLLRLEARAKEFAQSKGKLKKWLVERRLFHALLQDHLATAVLPGAAGAQINAASSRLFLEITDGMTEPLKGVVEEDYE